MDGKAKFQKRREKIEYRRENCVVSVYEVKICPDCLNLQQEWFLSRIFLEGKWLWNFILSIFKEGKRIPLDIGKIKEVLVKIKENFEKRQLKALMAQPRQAIIKRIIDALKALKKLRENGHKIGEIKYKSDFFSVPLPQCPHSFHIIGKNKIKITGCKKPFRVRGLEQIPPNAEITSAYLVKKPSGYYVLITCWVPKKSSPKKPQLRQAVGIDFGIHFPVVLSIGLAILYLVAPSTRLKRLQRALARKVKGSKNYRKVLRKIQREYERLTNIRKDCRNRIKGFLLCFGAICIQDENLKAWQQRWDRQMSWRGIGGITSGISPETLITLPRYMPTSQHCSLCGYHWGKLDLSIRKVACPGCGVVWDRDHNAARNILKYGLAARGLSPPSGTDGVTPVEWQEAGRRLLASPYLRVCYLDTVKQVSCA